jgi:hypothetical protein
MEASAQLHASVTLPPGTGPGSHCIGSWVDPEPRAGLDDMEKCKFLNIEQTKKQNQHIPWPDSVSELYPPSDRRLSAKLVPTYTERGVSSGKRSGTLRM